MSPPPTAFPVYLESGRKRVFAVAVDWPGLARSGRDESAALQALLEYAPRYRRAIAAARLGFRTPEDAGAFNIVERLEGNATTDFGAPDAVPKTDARPLAPADLGRMLALLRACWAAFDRAVADAAGVALRKGPRGGGRSLESIVGHCLDAETGDLARIGVRQATAARGSPPARIRAGQEASLAGFEQAVRAGIPAAGPRGGKRWAALSYVRRSAWHLLDHAWEIDDRAE